MPTKRKPGEWQDYAQRYRVARRTAYALHWEQHKESLIRRVGVPGISQHPHFYSDIQSVLPRGPSTDVDISALRPAQDTRLVVSVKRASSATVAGKRIAGSLRLVRKAELRTFGNWHAQPEMIPSAPAIGLANVKHGLPLANDALQWLQVATEIQRSGIANEVWTVPIVIQASARCLRREFRVLGTRLFSDPEKREALDDWVKSPSEILRRFNDTSLSIEERRLTVLFAETTAFDDSQRPELLSLLHRYILDERFSSDEDAQTSVGSAIRKFAMNMDESLFEQYAEFFGPSETETLSCELELELAKSLTWRIVYEPFDTNQDFPNLREKLTELAQDYLSPRLVLQKNYASVALSAVLAALLLGDDKSGNLVAEIHALKLDWFAALFVRRIRKTHEELKSRNASLAERLARSLTTRN